SLSNSSNADGGNTFSSGDSLTFTGSGELDNGMSVVTYQEIDGGTLDDRYFSVAMDGMGKMTFNAKGGSTAMSAVDDVTPTAYGESWDLIGHTATSTSKTTGQADKEGAIGGFATANSFFYDAPEMVDGLDVNVSYVPSGGTRTDGTISYALAYTGVEGLTVGYGADDNGLSGTSKIETETMYAKYAFGSFTVGFQESEQEQSGATASDDEFSAHGITYQVSDSLTIGYNSSERQFGDKTADQENKALSVSYTSGGMTISAASVSMDNVGGSTSSRDDVDGYAIDIGFAF
ncbi:porin, partial [Candidatus Pelagibacter sp.]|nr:porin [Candidatus Pelagibacter sp.]